MSRHRLWMPFLWLNVVGSIAAVVLLSGIGLGADQDDNASPKKNYSQEYYQSFKGKPNNTEGLVLKGPDAQEQVKYGPDGLRITLPAGYPDQRPGAGVALVTPVKGDFEFTMSFEILKEPGPNDAGQKYGTRVTLGVFLDTPEKNEGALSRRIDLKGNSQFATYLYLAKYPPNETPKPRYKATSTKIGRLRLVRGGSTLFCYASESADGEFIFLKEYPFSALPVKSAYVTASTGGPKAELDVRVTDFRVRADSLPDLPQAALNAAPAPMPAAIPVDVASPAKSRTWLVAGLIVGLGLISSLAIAVAAWLVLRRRRSEDAA